MDNEADTPWDPSIYAAHASGQDKFCVALMNIESTDPFTALVNFDGAVSQPWARTDIPREIHAVTSAVGVSAYNHRYVALSNEGNVYYINGKSIVEKIAGAGLLSPDASGGGILRDIIAIGEDLWAVGWSGQVYVKSGTQDWQRVPFGITSPAGFRLANLEYIAGSDSNDLYICGILRPELIEIDQQTVEHLLNSDADPDTWDAAFEEFERQKEDLQMADEGRLFHWDGVSFRNIRTQSPPAVLFRSIFVETPDLVWVVGTEGAVVRGNAASGFKGIGRFDQGQRFVSITKFRKSYVLASEDRLWNFDGLNATPFKAPFQQAPLRPLKVQAIDDFLFYFDNRSGVFRFDGSAWENIDIPSTLYDRQFKRL